MRRTRTTKFAASRVDPTYIRKPRRVRTWTYVLSGMLVLLAFLWWGLYDKVFADRTLESPGHLTSSHAMWESDCGKCHIPVKKEGKLTFLSAVSDSACLQCHDGAVHHHNQKTMVTAAADVPMVGKRSADCVACHIEHRGSAPLLARGDSACVSCHKDLNAVSEKPPLVQPVVEHFALGQHPPFGRELTESKKFGVGPTTWIDPTPLQFNHKVHMAQVVTPPPGKAENCEVCHQPSADVGVGEAGRDSQRYMKPVSYEQHCATCHPLSLSPNGPTIPHADMSIVRRELSNLAGLERSWLNAQPEDVRRGLLVKAAPAARPGIPGVRPRPGAATAAPTVITPSEWAKKEADAALKKASDHFDELTEAQLPGHDQLDALLKAAATPPDTADLSKLELIVAYDGPPSPIGKNHGGCALCHKVSGSPTTVYESLTAISAKPAAAAAASGPATQATPSLLATAATGYGSLPRHWFRNSHFNHDAHRSMACVECHGKATTSELTSDVLSPNIEMCVKCHNEPTRANPGAGNACQLCHTFHDRSLDRDAVGGGLSISALSGKGGASTQPLRQ